ncbi:MAG: cytochrome c biogenesis protein ResB [Candidatus Hydrogenedentota bacterium]
MSNILKRSVDLLASYGLAIVVLFFLLVLTLLGTIAQVEMGLFEAQKKYFESFYLVHEFRMPEALPVVGGAALPVLLPGAYLLLVVLFVNILLGAIIRAPKNWRRPGMLITHGGILLLLLGGFVTNEFSQRGYMQLYEGESARTIRSYHDWEITVTATEGANAGKAYIIPGELFTDLESGGARTFQHPGLPFDLLIEGYMRNCQPQPAVAAAQGIDGFRLERLEPAKQAEANAAGAYATAITPEGDSHAGILFGYAQAPWTFTAGGARYAVKLRKKEFPIPFTIRLDNFIHEMHPGTRMASNFESEVTKIEDGSQRRITIRMNEPLRHKGYTFFQASWGPQNAAPDQALFSVFEVVRNPADQWPLYACVVISFGMALHFMQKLLAHLKRQNRSRA